MQVQIKESLLPATSLTSGKGSTLPIYDLTPFTMLDFPGKTACIIWLSGCNMRCGYCHNPQIVKSVGNKSPKEIFTFLKKRKGLLDGVVISGGEPTLYPALIEFIEQIRALGYAIKLDTNGTRPKVLKKLLENGWINYVALDYKAPPSKYLSITHNKQFSKFHQSLSMLCAQKSIPFEVRTTVHTDLLQEEDLNLMIKDLDALNYRGTYYIQNFCSDNERETLGNLSQQTHKIDTHKIKDPMKFTIKYRNFHDISITSKPI